MTVKMAAERLEISPSLCYSLIAAGRLRHYRIGTGRGAIRVPDEAIGEFLKGVEIVVRVVPVKKRVFRHISVPR